MTAGTFLDPATLCLWWSPDSWEWDWQRQGSLEVFEAARSNKPSQVLKILDLVDDDRLRGRYGALAISVWHESRHFLDLTLTNYGAFRLRQFFSVYANGTTLILRAMRNNRSVFVPLEAALDPVRQRFHSIDLDIEDLHGVAKDIRDRKRMLAQDHQPLITPWGKLEFSGESLLEVVAFGSQMAGSLVNVGTERTEEAWRSIPERHRVHPRYRWMENVLIDFNLARFKEKEGVTYLHSPFMIALPYAALMIRAWGQPQILDGRDASAGPGDRFIRLLFALLKHPGAKGVTSEVEAWNLLNDLCKDIWGRSATEELQSDFALEKEYLERFNQQDWIMPEVKAALTSVHELRGKLINVLNQSPAEILDPFRYARSLAPKLRPFVVQFHPKGRWLSPPEGLKRVFGYSAGPVLQWWWAASPASDFAWGDSDYQLGSRENWSPIIDTLAPMAKLFINGRRHRLQLGPELMFAEECIRKLGVHLKIDPQYSFPPEDVIAQSADFWDSHHLETAICDLCHASVTRESGKLVSTWYFRRSNALMSRGVALKGGEMLGRLLARDWSPWLLCSKCVV